MNIKHERNFSFKAKIQIVNYLWNDYLTFMSIWLIVNSSFSFCAIHNWLKKNCEIIKGFFHKIPSAKISFLTPSLSWDENFQRKFREHSKTTFWTKFSSQASISQDLICTWTSNSLKKLICFFHFQPSFNFENFQEKRSRFSMKF